MCIETVSIFFVKILIHLISARINDIIDVNHRDDHEKRNIGEKEYVRKNMEEKKLTS